LTVGSGGVAAQLLTVITMPVITRLYAPDAYAGWALLMSVVIIFTSVATLRYELAIVLPKTHDEAANVLVVCILSTVITSLCTIIILSLWGKWLIGGEFYEEMRRWIWSVPPLIIFTGVYQASIWWCTRTQEFVWYSISQITLPSLTIAGQIAAALAGWQTASGLIVGTIVGQAASAAVIFVFVFKKYGPIFHSSITSRKIVQSAHRYRNYPLYMTPYTLVGTLRDRLVYFLLANYSLKAELGYYSLSARLVNLPNSLVSSAVRPVFFQKAATIDFKSMEDAINSALRLLAISVVPFWILFLFHSKTLFALVFGEPWREAGIYASILSFPVIPLLLGNWLDRAFDVLGRQRLAFTLELVFSLISIVALTVGVVFFNNMLLAVGLQAAVLTFYYSYWLNALFRAATFNRNKLLKLIGLVLLVGLISILISWLIALILPNILAIVVNGVIIGIGVSAYLIGQWGYLKSQF